MLLYHEPADGVGVAGRRQRRNATNTARVFLLMALGGCVSVERPNPDGGVDVLRGDAIESWAREVFNRQNALSADAATALLALESSAAADALDGALGELDAACAPLNALAALARDGERPGLLAQRRFAAALPACHAASDTLARHLRSVE